MLTCDVCLLEKECCVLLPLKYWQTPGSVFGLKSLAGCGVQVQALDEGLGMEMMAIHLIIKQVTNHE